MERLDGRRGAASARRGDVSILLSVGPAGELPTEFRLFRAGVNATSKGDFVFDAEAAAAVMADYHEHGVELMIDLEHLSVAAAAVTGDGRNFDPDARGWASLEVRDGDLWAVNVTWTAEGAARLRERRQRYVSPAFDADDSGRVTAIYNIALTSIPATHDAPALVASANDKQRDGKIMDPRVVKMLRLIREGKTANEALQILAMDVKTLQSVVKAMGGDPSGDLATLIGTITAFAQELADAAMGKTAEPVVDAEPVADAIAQDPPAEEEEKVEEVVRALSAATGETTVHGALRRIGAWKQSAVEHERQIATLARERATLEAGERRSLVAELVKLGRETPATAWADRAATMPKGILSTMPMDELRERVHTFGGSVGTTATPASPPSTGAPVTQTNLVEVSEFERGRVRAHASKNSVDQDEALRRYVEVKEQQVRGAEQKGTRSAKRLSHAIEQAHVLGGMDGRFGHHELQLLSTPVKPIEEFGQSSQRALEEFRLEYNATLVSLPQAWSEQIGTVLPGGSLQDTYPIAFEGVAYREKIAQGAAATTPNVADITVKKKEFSAAKQAQLIRITRGDFAYVQTWQQNAATLARARVNMRNHLVSALLEAGTSGYWGQTAERPTGIDGQPFFSASHKVNPFDPKMTFHGATTWSNYQGSAAPLNASNLTAEKGNMIYIPGPDGEELGSRATGMLVPTVLDEPARLLLTVQDLIMDASDTAGIRNEHYMSGFSYVWAPQLAGTGATADYYLYSMESISRGLPPWVLAEDASEELRTWDESSDFYKDSGMIKVESIVFANAALLYPHSIRLVAGS